MSIVQRMITKLAAKTLTWSFINRFLSNGEIQIWPLMDFDNILYVECRSKIEIIIFLEGFKATGGGGGRAP